MKIDPEIVNWLIGGGAITLITAISGLLKIWWDKTAEVKREKQKAKLAEKAMKYDKQDAADIYKNYLNSNKKEKPKE